MFVYDISMNEFEQYITDAAILRALQDKNIQSPTPIQAQAIPVAMQGRDIVAKAPTGTGKTLAFVLPMVCGIDREDKHVQAVILCPTRELVIQICEVIQQVCTYYEGVRAAGLYGGQNLQRQLLFLRKKPQILVATPGRMLDHLARRTVRMAHVRYFVLDECDVMLDMGFIKDVEQITSHMPAQMQRSVYSATIPREIESLCGRILQDPVQIVATRDGSDLPDIAQYFAIVKDNARVGVVTELIERNAYRRVMVFCNTKIRCERVGTAMQARGVSAQVLHGDLRQSVRTQIMHAFKQGDLRVLVATDVAARGIDVENVDAVFNFDPPTDSDFYLHRIGRTARAEKGGVAYTLIDAAQTGFLPSYQKVSHNALQPLELQFDADAYTLPRDASNRMRDGRADTKRFFINVGSRDGLDKDACIKLVGAKCDIRAWQIVDVKLRDTYGFIEVTTDAQTQIMRLAGVTIGTRKLRIQEANAQDKPTARRGDADRKRPPRGRADAREDDGIGQDSSDAPRDRKRTDFDKDAPRERRAPRRDYGDRPYGRDDASRDRKRTEFDKDAPRERRAPRRDRAGAAGESPARTGGYKWSSVRTDKPRASYGVDRDDADRASSKPRNKGKMRTPDGKILNPKPRGKRQRKL